ncbi:MAG: TIGR00341 family protein [Halobacteriaceae archaeon]
MRLIQLTVPAGNRETALGVLDAEDVDYVVTEETSGREVAVVVHFPLPTEAVEPILDRLRDAGIGEETYTVVLDARTVVSEHFDELSERYAEEADTERIAREELKSTAGELAPSLPTYAVFTVISAVIATAGLLLDSPAVVVGSMVIAPLIGPAMTSAVGTVLDDGEMWSRGIRLQVLGLLIAVGSAAAFGLVVKTLMLVPPGLPVTELAEVRERLAPDFLSLAIALGAGVAGAASLTTGVSAALVGVMIAVALMPPAATVGIGIAWGMPTVAAGAGVLALVNWLSINLAAIVVLWYRGYRPESWFHLEEARSSTVKRVAVLAVAIALLSVFLGGVTLASADHAAFEQRVASVARDVVGDEPGLSVLSTEVRYGGGTLHVFGEPTRVVVTVGRSPGTDTAALAARIRERLGRDVAVHVRYVEVEVAGAGAARSPAASPRSRVGPAPPLRSPGPGGYPASPRLGTGGS